MNSAVKQKYFSIESIIVDPEGNVVKFMLRRGLFTAHHDTASHIHHRRNPHHSDSSTTVDIDMTASLVGAPESNMAVLFCQACGLRIQMSAFSLRAEDLRHLFSKRADLPDYKHKG